MDTKVSEDGGALLLLGVVTPGAPECAREGAIETETELTYQYRIFLPRGEAYAFRLASSEVTGVYGPLDYREVLFNALPSFPYEDQIDDVVWVKSSLSDFMPCDAEYEEGMIWI